MAERHVVELLDDLDGSKADETVRFDLDGRTYEIDLSAQNAHKLRATLQPYVTAGRRKGSRRAQPLTPAAPGGARADDSRQIREWARARGLEVSPRGRIPAYLRQAFERR